jgi:hypothetical protein
MIIKVTLTTAGTDTGPFNIYSNSDSYTTPVATGVAKSALLPPGYDVTVPNDATIVRVASTGTCTNYINIPITVTYVMQLTTDYDFLNAACADNTAVQTVTYTGNLAPGTQLNGVVFQGDVGFMKIISSTEPGFTYVGDVINCINGLDTVYSIDACP